MATRSLSPNHAAERVRQLRAAAMSLAMMRSRQCIRDALQRQGKKVSLVPSAEITAMAKVHLAAHRDALMGEAKAIVEQWMLDGFFGKRALRQWLRANLESDAQPQLEPNSMASVVQISGAK